MIRRKFHRDKKEANDNMIKQVAKANEKDLKNLHNISENDSE